jgi:hypothetical protein
MSTSTPPGPTRTAPRHRRTRLMAGLGVAAAVLAAVPLAGTAMADENLVPGTPCVKGTAACVQLGSQGHDAKAWLIRDDRVVRGPVSASTGGPGSDTPTGTWAVTRKERDHTSSETTNAFGSPSEMPYSVFFGDSGYAFHGGGDPKNRTAGCVRLSDSDARYFYDNLDKGDKVEVVDRSAEVSDGPRRRGRDRDGGGLLGGL